MLELIPNGACGLYIRSYRQDVLRFDAQAAPSGHLLWKMTPGGPRNRDMCRPMVND